MSINIELHQLQVSEVLSVDFGEGETTITYVDGRFRVGTEGWATVIRLKPQHVRWLIAQLEHSLTTNFLEKNC